MPHGLRGRLGIAGVAMIVTIGNASAVHATTYYVSPTGSDASSGTESQPFKTIQRAADMVMPGDVVLVEDGVYTGTGAGTPCASATERPIVCLTRGGDSTALVTFKSRNPHGARLDGQSNMSTSGFRFRSTANYIRIEGFEIFGLGSATNGVSGIQMYAGGHDSQIVGNDLHDIGRLCADHIYGMNGIFVQQQRVLIESNTIHDIGRYAPGEKNCSPSTTNYQNHDHGIYIDGASDSSAPGAADVTVVSNVFSAIGHGWPIQIYPGSVANIEILNNTFVGANPYRVGQILMAASTNNAEISNNIFYQPTTAAINFNAGTHTGMVIANNITSASIASSRPTGVMFSTNAEQTDPQFATADFRLQPTSPAVDLGLPLADVKVDVDGIVRPQRLAWDIGARELPSAGSPDPPPPPPADTIAPTVSITSPADGARVSAKNVTFTAVAADNVGVARVQFAIDGVVFATDTTAPYTASRNLRKAASGPHVVLVIATDAAGNAASTSITVWR